MRKILRFLCFTILFFAIIFKWFAIDSPSNVKVDSSTNNSLMLTWDKIDWALAYDVYYYDSEWSEDDILTVDLIEDNSVEINWLEAWKTYVFRVVAYDDSWETGEFSEETYFEIKWEADTASEDDTTSNNVNDFVLKTAKLLDYDLVELEFSDELDSSEDAVREFKIENTEDMFDSFEVLEAKLNDDDASKIELSLDRELTIWNEYEIVIVAITSSNGDNIESWIDNSETVFVEEIDESQNNEMTSAWPSEWNFVEPEPVVVEEQPKWNLAWTNIDDSEIKNTVSWAAADQDNLPQTGPEHVLVFILSVILWALIFIFKFKKS